MRRDKSTAATARLRAEAQLPHTGEEGEAVSHVLTAQKVELHSKPPAQMPESTHSLGPKWTEEPTQGMREPRCCSPPHQRLEIRL